MFVIKGRKIDLEVHSWDFRHEQIPIETKINEKKERRKKLSWSKVLQSSIL